MGDIYDEEYHAQLLIAKSLIKQLRKPEDRKVCQKWITKLSKINAADPVVKKHRNAFFKYMIQVIRDGTLRQAPAEPHINDKSNIMEQKEPFMSHWSKDRRSYIAAKPIPGKGALVYMAVSKNPELGWDIPNQTEQED